MNHLSDDELLLFAWGEAEEHAAHLAGCDDCRARLAAIEESRVLIGLAAEQDASARRRPLRRLAWIALPLAAGIAALMLSSAGDAPPDDRRPWSSHVGGSPYAGYIAGGPAFAEMDAMLSRLEQGGTYGSPDKHRAGSAAGRRSTGGTDRRKRHQGGAAAADHGSVTRRRGRAADAADRRAAAA